LHDCEFGELTDWEHIGFIAKGGRWRIQLEGIEDEEKDLDARKLFRFLLAAANRGALPKPFTLHIDEVDLYGNAWLNDKSLVKLARFGRHWDFSFIVNARRYADIPKDWTSQSDAIILGPSVDMLSDGRVVRGIIGSHMLKAWERLERYQFIIKTLDGCGYIGYSAYEGYIRYTRYTGSERGNDGKG
jgi:hypothetical protein